MKAGWQVKKLGEVLEVQNGYAFDSGNFSHSNGMPLIRIRDLRTGTTTEAKFIGKFDQKYVVNAGDFLIGMDGEFACHEWKGEPALLNQRVCRLKIFSDKLSSRFLFYGINEHLKQIEAVTGYATVKHISSKQILNIQFPIPHLTEQQRIVAILDEAFDGIATAEANAEKNLQNARELFESHLQSVFSKRGDGWVEKKLGDKTIVEIIDGDRGTNYPKATDFLDDGYCLFLNTKNVRPDGFAFESMMFITQEKDGQLCKGKLQRNDVVMTTRGTIGNLGLFSEVVEYEHIRINSGMLIFRVNPKAILPAFLFEVLRSGIVKGQIERHVSGAAQPQLPIKTLVNFTIPVPENLSDQQSIVTKVRELGTATQRLEAIYQRKLAALDELKKSLLHQAFNGDL